MESATYHLKTWVTIDNEGLSYLQECYELLHIVMDIAEATDDSAVDGLTEDRESVIDSVICPSEFVSTPLSVFSTWSRGDYYLVVR
jgi:hypothetical protein